MSRPVPGKVTSADGTPIAFGRSGTGPAVILVHGAFTDRTHPTLRGVAAALRPWFTVYNYDRRGRGGSGDTPPYAVEREVEDIAALVTAAGGTAMLFGGSSGAVLALRAAGDPGVSKLAVWEPPYRVGDRAPGLPYDLASRLAALAGEGRRGEAVELFMVRAAGVPAAAVAAMRAGPSWRRMEEVAHTLAYEAAVMGPGDALPAEALASIRQPVLVLTGGESPRWAADAGRAVAAAVPRTVHRVLEGQAHDVSPRSLAPELLEFFVAA